MSCTDRCFMPVGNVNDVGVASGRGLLISKAGFSYRSTNLRVYQIP